MRDAGHLHAVVAVNDHIGAGVVEFHDIDVMARNVLMRPIDDQPLAARAADAEWGKKPVCQVLLHRL